MSQTDTTDQTEPQQEVAWSLIKYADNPSASLELGEMYADTPGAALTVLTHKIGETLIKVGTMLLQSSIGDDDEDGDDW